MATLIAVKFKRVTVKFDEMVKRRICESSGTEHSPVPAVVKGLTDLSRLVNSFLEGEATEKLEEVDRNVDASCFDESVNSRNLLNSDENSGDDLKRNITKTMENALLAGEANERSSQEFKRWLMAQLHDRGFDARFCKSKWEKVGNSMSESYEYIDVNMDDNSHYIIEVALVKEFEIACATPCYASLLKNFPRVFVGNVEDLKQVVKIMSIAMKKSLKNMDMYVPPSRRLAYKRTTNEKNSFDSPSPSKKRNVGFVPMGAISFYSRENITASNSGIKMGNLATGLNG